MHLERKNEIVKGKKRSPFHFYAEGCVKLICSMTKGKIFFFEKLPSLFRNVCTKTITFISILLKSTVEDQMSSE